MRASDSYDNSHQMSDLGFDIQSIIAKLTGGGSSSSGGSSGGNILTKIESFLSPGASSTPAVLPAPMPALAPTTTDTGPGLMTWVLIGGSAVLAIGLGVYYYKKRS